MRTLALLASVLGTVARVQPIALVSLVLVCAALFLVRARRGSAAEAARTMALDLAMLSWLGLILLQTVVPYGHSVAQPIGFVPFLDAIQRVANNESYPSAEVGDIVANVLVFMPLGIGAALRWGRRWMIPFIGGAAAVSFGIELTQALEATGRFASATDVVTNTTGAALGFMLGLRWRERRDAPAYDRPTFAAVRVADDRRDP